jgi:hypothetical protein
MVKITVPISDKSGVVFPRMEIIGTDIVPQFGAVRQLQLVRNVAGSPQLIVPLQLVLGTSTELREETELREGSELEELEEKLLPRGELLKIVDTTRVGVTKSSIPTGPPAKLIRYVSVTPGATVIWTAFTVGLLFMISIVIPDLNVKE